MTGPGIPILPPCTECGGSGKLFDDRIGVTPRLPEDREWDCEHCDGSGIEPTVPCAICAAPLVHVGAHLCDPCWEADRRLADFAKTAGGRARLVEALAAAGEPMADNLVRIGAVCREFGQDDEHVVDMVEAMRDRCGEAEARVDRVLEVLVEHDEKSQGDYDALDETLGRVREAVEGARVAGGPSELAERWIDEFLEHVVVGANVDHVRGEFGKLVQRLDHHCRERGMGGIVDQAVGEALGLPVTAEPVKPGSWTAAEIQRLVAAIRCLTVDAAHAAEGAAGRHLIELGQAIGRAATPESRRALVAYCDAMAADVAELRAAATEFFGLKFGGGP